MKNSYFQSLEKMQKGQIISLDQVMDEIQFNDKGLIPVIAQDSSSKDVLMLAWMNRASMEHTLSTGRMTYWSRSREQLWIKGETSGHIQLLESMRLDCDGDALVCLVKQTGPACHTGRDNCFYFEFDIHNQSIRLISSRP